MPAKPKPYFNSRAAQRELVKLAKTLDLKAIARKTGRKPEGILETAKRLGISIKGSKTIRRQRS